MAVDRLASCMFSIAVEIGQEAVRSFSELRARLCHGALGIFILHQ